jgi:DNA topoisomerase-1
VDLRDRRLAGVVRRCQELPGQELFQYLDDDGQPVDVTSDDINAYLREAAGADVTTRDFRVWAGTVLAYRALSTLDPANDDRAARRNVVEAVRVSAGQLGNTEAVARRSYVHPAVLEAYLDGELPAQGRKGRIAPADTPTLTVADPASEAAVLALLSEPLQRDAKRSVRSIRSGRAANSSRR